MRFYWPIAKVDGEQRMVWGYASTEAVDDQGETVSRDALAAALDDYMRFANIREMHQNSAIGVAREAGIDERGLYIGAKIVDDDAWRKVVEGVYKGFSIGGRVTARDLSDRTTITGLVLTEISVVDRPANPDAVFDCWKLATDAAAGDGVGTSASAARQPAESHSNTGDSAAGSVDYADPGYQADGRKRYPLDTERHIRAAWAFIHRPANARRYSPDQVDRIKARIGAAWRAEIDRAGPPAAAMPGRAADARKSLADADRLAQVIVELDWLDDCLALETVLEGDASALPQRMQQIIAELRDFLASLVAEESAEPLDGSDDMSGVALAAAAAGGMLRKAPSRPDVLPVFRGLAKLAEAIVPRLDALSKRVEEIARTPLPPQTVARNFAGIGKREDGGGPITSTDDIVAALARMNDEERTLTLIKAAHANPRTPF